MSLSMSKIHFYNFNGILLPKLFLPTVRKKCSSDREKLEKTSFHIVEQKQKRALKFVPFTYLV